MHPLHVDLELLRLAELLATDVAEGSRSSRIRGTAVGAVHVQVVEAQKVLKGKNKNKT